jgi:hypothetical protein
MDEPLNVLLEEVSRVETSDDGSLRWLVQKLVLARGYYAPEHFEYEGWIEKAEMEAAWGALVEQLPQRELLLMGSSLGGHPGGSWEDVVRAHDLPTGGCLYSWQTDIADLGRQATLLIGIAERMSVRADHRVVELALTDEPEGLRLAANAFGGTLDGFRTVLPPARAVPLLVAALEAEGELYGIRMERVASQAPEELEPWETEWKTWFVEEFFWHYLPTQ